MWPFSSSPSSDQQKSQEATSMDGTYKPMNRNERIQCWDARDAYFKCLDKNNILDAIKDADKAKANCARETEIYERDCATSWVQYFKQKRVADFQKDQQRKKLEAEGAIPIEQATEKSKWKFW